MIYFAAYHHGSATCGLEYVAYEEGAGLLQILASRQEAEAGDGAVCQPRGQHLPANVNRSEGRLFVFAHINTGED